MGNLIVTGLPRAGSASVSALIDTMHDAVCLNTPPWQEAFARNPVEILPFCKWLVGDFAWARCQLMAGVPIADMRLPDGSPLADDDEKGTNVSFIRPHLSPNFTLAMRQTTLFTSVLPLLSSFQHFQMVAVIRHPVALCLAWLTLPQPLLSQGNPPGIARFWPQALEVLQGGKLLEQYAALYELFVQRYHDLGVTVLRHEDVLANPLCVPALLGQTQLPAAAARLRTPDVPETGPQAESLRRIFRQSVYAKMYYPDLG
ncbi:MAG: hypothetical protein K2Q01_02800 [Rickettsiales bacterium]|nr:hypothetical protein [Rickettsiales bacterium]